MEHSADSGARQSCAALAQRREDSRLQPRLEGVSRRLRAEQVQEHPGLLRMDRRPYPAAGAWEQGVVPERHLAPMLLQQDMAVGPFAIARDVLELALRVGVVKLLRGAVVIENLLAVEPVLHMIAAHQNPRCVPFADRGNLLLLLIARQQIIERTQPPIAVPAQLG